MLFRKNKGFTLYETVMVIGIFVLIVIIIPPLFINFSHLFTFQNNLADVEIQNQFAMDAMAEEAKKAKGILPSHTVNGTLYTTASTTVVFEYPVFNTNAQIVANETDYGAFFLQATDTSKLMFTFEASPSSARSDESREYAHDVDTLIFRYNTSDVASTTVMTVLLQSTISQAGIESTVTQTSALSLRNQ